MSRHGFIADVHLDNFKEFKGAERAGVNYRATLCLEVTAKAAGQVDYLHILGDVFHHPYIMPQLMTALMEVLKEAFAWSSLKEVRIIIGNHDMLSDTPGDHALGPLGKMPGVFVYDRPKREKVGELDIFYVPFGHDVLEFSFKDAPQVTCIHQGIVHEGTSDFLKESGVHRKTLEKWMRSHKRGAGKLLLAGDWHDHMHFPNGVVQVGTLCPHSWSDRGRNRGQMIIVDDEADFDKTPAADLIKVIQIPGPRFLFAVDKPTAVEQAGEFLRAGCVPFTEYALEVDAKGAKVKGQELPILDGAHFRAEKPKKKLSESEYETASVAMKIRNSKTFEELLENYCRVKYPTRWEQVFNHTLRYLDYEK